MQYLFFFAQLVQPVFYIHFQHHIAKLSRCFCSIFQSMLSYIILNTNFRKEDSISSVWLDLTVILMYNSNYSSINVEDLSLLGVVILVGLLDPESDNIAVLWNIRNCPHSDDIVSHKTCNFSNTAVSTSGLEKWYCLTQLDHWILWIHVARCRVEDKTYSFS